MDVDEIWIEIFNDDACVILGSVDFDEEFFTISNADYKAISMARSYVVLCEIPETDFDQIPVAWCRGVGEVEAFMNDQVASYIDVEGAVLTVDDDLPGLLAPLPDKLSEVCEILDGTFEESRSERIGSSAGYPRRIPPSVIVKELVNGIGLRPEVPDGFIIDAGDEVYIQDGTISFSPIRGSEGYFSDELGIALDCFGIAWRRQRFVRPYEKGDHSPSRTAAEEFLDQFNHSKSYLVERQARSELQELKDQKAVLALKIKKLRDSLSE